MIPLKYVDRAHFPFDVTIERIGSEDLFLLRCGDYVWDWSVYDWVPRWTHDYKDDRDVRASECDWFVGRYYVPAERIERDFDPECDYPGGPCTMAGGLKQITPPSWFRGR